MTDAPERILSCDGCRATGYWHCSMPDHCGFMVEYIRADKANELVEAERLRFGNIAATIRINALRYGATDEQVAQFLTGEADFIGWMIDTIRRAAPATVAEQLGGGNG